MMPSHKVQRDEDWFAILRPETTKDLDISLVHNIRNAELHTIRPEIRFSSDGESIALYWLDGSQISARVFRVRTGSPISNHFYRPTTSDSLTSYSFGFDSEYSYIAAGFATGRIVVWSVANDTELQLCGHLNKIVKTVFSQDSDQLLSSSADMSVKLWDCRTGQLLQTWATEATCFYLAISRNGKFAAAKNVKGQAYAWDLDSRSEHVFLDTNKGREINTFAFSQTEKGGVISGFEYGMLTFWELPSTDLGVGSSVKAKTTCSKFVGHTDLILSVDSSLGGKWIASCSNDKSVRFWDPVDKKSRMLLYGHPIGGYYLY